MSNPPKEIVTEYSGEYIKIDGYCYKFEKYTNDDLDDVKIEGEFVNFNECNKSKINFLSLGGEMKRNDFKIGDYGFPVEVNGLNFETQELTVGSLSLHENNNATFDLVNGEGDDSNHLFKIISSNILQMNPFSLGSYKIRLQSMNDDGVIFEESVEILLSKVV
jgi:hypothetical protein